jgi:LysR family glycine cleavage system transcriptional activator
MRLIGWRWRTTSAEIYLKPLLARGKFIQNSEKNNYFAKSYPLLAGVNLPILLRRNMDLFPLDDQESYAMVYRLPPLNALRAFEAAASHLSFKKAAEDLSVTPTAVSHQIKGLESFLGVVLFHRLTRALELTPEGEALLPKVREGMACLASAVECSRAARTNHLPDRLVVCAPPSFAARWLVPRLRRFAARQPGIELHVASSLAAIDSARSSDDPSNGTVRLHEEDSQIWIRFGMGRYPNFRVDKFLAPNYIAVCSPELFASGLPPRAPEEVRLHCLIHDDTIANEKARPSWTEWLQTAGVTGVDATAGPHFRDSGLAIAAALDGLGIALAFAPLVSADIAEGRLVSPFDIAVGQRYAYYLAIPEAMAERPAVALFREWLLQEVDHCATSGQQQAEDHSA